ncbi:MAG TPA: glycosyltransferase [Candidatus Acidoferrales bacterium]|jgi:glycosyltransferase involved in cell wall biosynthesis|nr:glycosyltransferase [Candidatus Acidoferrales bacterium]
MNSQLITVPGSSTESALKSAPIKDDGRSADEAHLSLVMLVGRQDEPTDAVRDYVTRLTEALRRQGVDCQTYELRWDERGWIVAMAALWKHSRAWAGRWVVLQYTALMWSRRGFPLLLPLALKILRVRRCRVGVVFHDGYAAAGSRWIDRIRALLQERLMRHFARNASRAIYPVALRSACWPQSGQHSCEFIPVGANVPSFDELHQSGCIPGHKIPTVAVFGIPTWPAAQTREVTAIVEALRRASLKIRELQLVVVGRGATQAESLLRRGLSGTGVSVRVVGVRSGAEISSALCSSDVFLFVRGGLSTRRGSGLAALGCGLPVVAYRGEETGFPLTDAGIVFVPEGDVELLGDELARVLLDRELRLQMSERNLAVFRQWFSWDQIASRWIGVLRLNKELSK